MLSTNNSDVTENLQTEPISCLGYIEQSKLSSVIKILMGAESGQFVLYSISNNSKRYMIFDVTTLTIK